MHNKSLKNCNISEKVMLLFEEQKHLSLQRLIEET